MDANEIDAGTLNNVQIKVVEGGAATTATTASYNGSAGIDGVLTITLANNAPVTAAAINNAIATLGSGFTNLFTATATANVGNAVIMPATVVGQPLSGNLTVSTSGGLNNVTDVDATMAGATVNGQTFGNGAAGTAGLAANLVVELGGAEGTQQFSFVARTTAAQMQTAIHNAAGSTGVDASVNNGTLKLFSTDYGSNAFVNVNVVSEGNGGLSRRLEH